MEKDLIALLLADATLTAVVGQRVTPLARTQGDPLPAVTVARVSGGPEYADDGDAGIQGVRVQVDCWADTYAAAKDAAALVMGRLSALRDVVQGATTFIFITLMDERDGREPGYNTPDYQFRVSLDFNVWSNS